METARKPFLSVTLKDCEMQTFRASGPGGTKRNKTSSGVRIIHSASGARGEASDSRSQHDNKRTAFIRMTQTNKFKIWLNKAIYGAKPTPEEQVAEDMAWKNLRIEVKDLVTGEWVVGSGLQH